jgi:hypothetical protein
MPYYSSDMILIVQHLIEAPYPTEFLNTDTCKWIAKPSNEAKIFVDNASCLFVHFVILCPRPHSMVCLTVDYFFITINF